MCIQRENIIPFFATTKEPIEFIGKYNICDEGEYAMLSSRWVTFNFTHQIENAKLENCSCCFSKLVLMGAEEDN